MASSTTRTIVAKIYTCTCVLSSLISQLEGTGELYKILSPSCKVLNIPKVKSAESLATCGLMCTKSDTCDAFAVRQGDCGLLETCPPCDPTSSAGNDGWSVHCVHGIYLMTCNFMDKRGTLKLLSRCN